MVPSVLFVKFLLLYSFFCAFSYFDSMYHIFQIFSFCAILQLYINIQVISSMLEFAACGYY